MARTEKLKPILTGNNVSDFIMPTFGEFPSEYHQAYEVLKKRRTEEIKECKKKLEDKYEDEDLQKFLATLKNNHRDNITQVEEIKSPPPCSNLVEPFVIPRQEEEALQSNKNNEDKENNSTSMKTSVFEKTESKNTYADSIESKEASGEGSARQCQWI
jgi:hypothetical protein